MVIIILRDVSFQRMFDHIFLSPHRARSAEQSYRDMAEVRDQPDVSPSSEEPFDYSPYAK